jgi:rhodanese-related sulfurtransferase
MEILLLIVLVLVLGWDLFWALLGLKPLFPWQLAAKLAQDPAELVLLDVRTPGEFRWFHLPGAQNVPFPSRQVDKLPLPRTKTVVVICMTGHRSPLVGHRLLKRGFSRVYNLTGGMAGFKVWEWAASGAAGKDSGSEGQ